MNPTLYVPNPIAGWDVPSRSGIVGQSMRDCFCSGVTWREDILFREVIFDDDLDTGPREDATKLATVLRLGRAAAIGFGSAVIRILSMPSSLIVCQQVLVVASCRFKANASFEN